MAQKLREASVAKAKERRHFRVTVRQVRPCYWDFKFYLCGQTIKVPSEMGLSMGLHLQPCVHVHCEVGAAQHESPYATRASWGSTERRLCICLKGCCIHSTVEARHSRNGFNAIQLKLLHVRRESLNNWIIHDQGTTSWRHQKFLLHSMVPGYLVCLDVTI